MQQQAAQHAQSMAQAAAQAQQAQSFDQGGGGDPGGGQVANTVGPATISQYDAQVMQEWGPRQSTARPQWVKDIFAAHPGFLTGATPYRIV
jgi:hypothetical protein